MRPSRPPVLASWFIHHVRFAKVDDALAGDLLEQFHQGRSSSWYCRQVIFAILVGFATAVRRQWPAALQAAAITWAANYVALTLVRWILARSPALGLSFHPGADFFVYSLVGGALGGSIVALAYRTPRSTMLTASAVALLAWAFASILFLKRGALQHSVLQIIAAALFYYAIALSGLIAGGMLPTLARRVKTRPEADV
jgi:hypothetical protein